MSIVGGGIIGLPGSGGGGDGMTEAEVNTAISNAIANFKIAQDAENEDTFVNETATINGVSMDSENIDLSMSDIDGAVDGGSWDV